MSSIGWGEILIVVVIALLVFGPKKLPDLGASLGRSISGFKKGLRETREEFQTAVTEDATVEQTAPAASVAPAASAAPAASMAPAEAAQQTVSPALTENLTETGQH